MLWDSELYVARLADIFSCLVQSESMVVSTQSLTCCSGTYDIFVEVNGEQRLIGAYDNKGSFGELALMYNMPRAATIVATSQGTLWAMVGCVFITVELVQTSAVLAHEVLQLIASKVSHQFYFYYP